MASFELQGPDGAIYEVEAPDEAQAVAAFKTMMGQPLGPTRQAASEQSRRGHDEMTRKAIQAIEFPDKGMLDANLLSFAQGGLSNFGDELFGAVEGVRSMLGGKPYGENYTKARDFARNTFDAISERYPKSSMASGIAGGITTGVPAAMATGATSLLPVMGVGALQGGAAAYGDARANDWDAVKKTLIGITMGGAGAAAGYGLGKAVESLTSRGLAADTILKGLTGSPDDLIREAQQRGIPAGEVDNVLQEIIRAQAAKNPNAAASLVPQAQGRVAAANTQIIDDVNRLISPLNATQLIDDLQRQGQSIGSAGYPAAYSNPATVGLVPDVAGNPAMADALKAAEKLAAAQGRSFDVTNLTVQDLDAIQRALKTSAERMYNSTPENTLLGPVYENFGRDINSMAGNMAPELAQTQAQYAAIKGAQEAVELGKKALDPSKEFVEVIDEFAQLSPQSQEAYRAGLATRLRTILQQKSPTSNSGVVINKEAIIEKMKAVGFPEDVIDQIISRGRATRGVLDALQGGSDTARKMAAAKASESPLSKVGGADLLAGAMTHWATLGILPAVRAAGRAQEGKAADLVLRALTDPSVSALAQLMKTAPQRFTPALGYTGGAAASSYSPF